MLTVLWKYFGATFTGNFIHKHDKGFDFTLNALHHCFAKLERSSATDLNSIQSTTNRCRVCDDLSLTT